MAPNSELKANEQIDPKEDITFKNPAKMTVCIACLANNGKEVFLAADDMTTHNLGGNLFYEECVKENKKIHKMTSSVYVLVAGSNHAELILANANIVDGNTGIIAINKIKEAHEQYISDIQLTRILRPNGFTDWQHYLDNQNKLHNVIAGDIGHKLTLPMSDAWFIVVDVTGDERACVRVLSPDCIIHDYSKYGFATIGNGSQLAHLSFMKSEYNKNMPSDRVKEIILEAMEDASHAPGVGKLGELVRLT